MTEAGTSATGGDPSTFCRDVFYHGGPHVCVMPLGHEGLHDCGMGCEACQRPDIARDMGKP